MGDDVLGVYSKVDIKAQHFKIQLSEMHCSDVIMRATVSQITGVSIVYSAICSGPDQRKHQSSVSLTSVRGIHRQSMNYPHKGPVTRKMFSFDDVIMKFKAVNQSKLSGIDVCHHRASECLQMIQTLSSSHISILPYSGRWITTLWQSYIKSEWNRLGDQ